MCSALLLSVPHQQEMEMNEKLLNQDFLTKIRFYYDWSVRRLTNLYGLRNLHCGGDSHIDAQKEQATSRDSGSQGMKDQNTIKRLESELKKLEMKLDRRLKPSFPVQAAKIEESKPQGAVVMSPRAMNNKIINRRTRISMENQ